MLILVGIMLLVTGGCLGYVIAFHSIEVKAEKDIKISVKMSEEVAEKASKQWTEKEIYDLIKAQDDFHNREVIESLNDTEDLLSTVSDLLSGDISLDDIETTEGDE